MRVQRGHSLIELMIAMALGLMLVASLLVVYANTVSASRTNERAADLQANGRIAISALKADLRAAGFKGFAWSSPNPASITLTPIGNECLEANALPGSFAANIGQAIWGSQGTNPFAANCIPRSHYAKGDVLVLRKLSPISSNGLVKGPLYVRSSYAASEVFGAPLAAPALHPCRLTLRPSTRHPVLQVRPELIYWISRWKSMCTSSAATRSRQANHH